MNTCRVSPSSASLLPSNMASGLQVEFDNVDFQVHSSRLLSSITRSYGPGNTGIPVLSGLSGVLPAGSMTLILASPGHGKTAFMRAIAGQLPQATGASSSVSTGTTGSIRYNGCTRQQLQSKAGSTNGGAGQARAPNGHGRLLHRMVSFLEQTDAHLAGLTVQETLLFASRNALPHIPSGSGTQAPGAGAGAGATLPTPHDRVTQVATALGLTECLHTRVGSDTERGISGGQRRRISIAEALLGYPQLLCLDEPTTGLDAAVALSILQYIRHEWSADVARVLSGPGQGSASGSSPAQTDTVAGPRPTVLASLLQPGPEMVALFDQVLCLQHGRIVYTGPPAGMVPHFEKASGRPCPPNVEPAEFAVQILGTVDLTAACGAGAAGLVSIPAKALGPATAGGLVVRTVDSPEASQAEPAAADPAAKDGVALPGQSARITAPAWHAPSPVEQALYCRPYARSTAYHTWLVVSRQASLVYWDTSFVLGHVLQATVMGLLLGYLFYKPPFDLFNLKLSVVLFAAFLLAFNNLPEVSSTTAARAVVTKHARAGLFPPTSFALAGALVSLPMCVIEVAILGSCVYKLVGFSDEAGRYEFFLLVLLLANVCLSAYFRLLACAAPSAAVAESLAAPSVGIFILFSGFLVTRLHIPDWLIWLYYISPFSWMLRSTTLNEFQSAGIYSSAPPTVPPEITYGFIFLNVFEMQTEEVWRWAGVGYLAGFWVVTVLLTALAVARAGRGGTAWTAGSSGTAGHAAGLALPATSSSDDDEAGQAATGAEETSVVNVASSVAQVAAVGAGAAATDTSGGTSGNGKAQAQPVPQAGSYLTFKDLRYTIPWPTASSTGAGVGARVRSTLVQAAHAGLSLLPSALAVPTGKASGLLQDRVLLDGLTGYACPGTLTAVMGASGAGKSTLFDVLAGLKTVGKASGAVYLDGRLLMDFGGISSAASGAGGTAASAGLLTSLLARCLGLHTTSSARSLFDSGCTGYVQQADLHEGTATVQEALMFSAALRLPYDYVPGSAQAKPGPAGSPSGESAAATRPAQSRAAVLQAVVAEVMEQLELTGLAHTRIGGGGSSSTGRVAWLAGLWPGLNKGANSRRSTNSSAALTPGQRKRLTIGVELVSRPRILLLDEPTSGLDAREAAVVMRVLRRLANSGMTVMATIHQPSYDVFSRFDRLLLLSAGGRQVYFGPLEKAGQATVGLVSSAEAAGSEANSSSTSGQPQPLLDPILLNTRLAARSLLAHLRAAHPAIAGYGREHFEGPGIFEPKDNSSAGGSKDAAGTESSTTATTTTTAKNPAAWALEALELVNISDGLAGSDALQAAYRASGMARVCDAVIQGVHGRAGPNACSTGPAAVFGFGSGSTASSSAGRLPGPVTQLLHLLLRSVKASYRDTGYTWGRLLAQIVVALLFGALFWRMRRDTAGGLETALAVWWMSLTFLGLLLFSTAMPHAVQARAVVHRETASHMYRPWMAGLATLLAEAPWVLLTSTTVSMVVYHMVGGRGGRDALANYWSAMALIALAYNSLGHWFAAAFPSLALAQIAGYFAQALLFLFGGLFIPLPSVPSSWRWLVTINPLRYAAHSVWSTQFFCSQDALDVAGRGEICPSFLQDPLPFPIREWDFVRDFLGLTYRDRVGQLGTTGLFVLGYTLAAVLTVQLINHIKR